MDSFEIQNFEKFEIFIERSGEKFLFIKSNKSNIKFMKTQVN